MLMKPAPAIFGALDQLASARQRRDERLPRARADCACARFASCSATLVAKSPCAGVASAARRRPATSGSVRQLLADDARQTADWMPGLRIDGRGFDRAVAMGADISANYSDADVASLRSREPERIDVERPAHAPCPASAASASRHAGGKRCSARAARALHQHLAALEARAPRAAPPAPARKTSTRARIARAAARAARRRRGEEASTSSRRMRFRDEQREVRERRQARRAPLGEQRRRRSARSRARRAPR